MAKNLLFFPFLFLCMYGAMVNIQLSFSNLGLSLCSEGASLHKMIPSITGALTWLPAVFSLSFPPFFLLRWWRSWRFWIQKLVKTASTRSIYCASAIIRMWLSIWLLLSRRMRWVTALIAHMLYSAENDNHIFAPLTVVANASCTSMQHHCNIPAFLSASVWPMLLSPTRGVDTTVKVLSIFARLYLR